MPNRVPWDPGFSVGNDVLDGQHRHALAQCDVLADHCRADDGNDRDGKFQRALDQLMAFAREHFATEASLLAGCGYPDLEDHGHEREEFEYLAAEIITTENFDKIELQRFLALWWAEHIMGSAKNFRAFLEKSPTACSAYHRD